MPILSYKLACWTIPQIGLIPVLTLCRPYADPMQKYLICHSLIGNHQHRRTSSGTWTHTVINHSFLRTAWLPFQHTCNRDSTTPPHHNIMITLIQMGGGKTWLTSLISRCKEAKRGLWWLYRTINRVVQLSFRELVNMALLSTTHDWGHLLLTSIRRKYDQFEDICHEVFQSMLINSRL